MKRKLLFAIAALLCTVGTWAQPTASTPVVGNTYYLYNPTTKLFMTTNVDLPFIRPTGSAWKLEAADGHDGWVTLRLKDSSTDGEGYFWGKWWANTPNANSSEYADERVFQLVNISGKNYKLKSYAWGTSEAYIYINNGNEGDRSFRLACNSHDQAGLDEGYVTWQFISEADYATYMADDYTSRISNNDFLTGISDWNLEGSGNKQAHGNTAIEYWNASAASGSFDYYQNLTNLPAGKYVLRAAMYNSTNGEEGASFNAAGQCGVYGTSNGVTKYANVTVDGTGYNIYTTDELLVPDGNLRLGFKNSTTMTARWFGADWIQLSCTEYCLSAVAVALPANGAMEADTWYYYNLPTSDDYDFTLSDAATLTYSTDGTQLMSEVTGTNETFTAGQTKTLNLSAGRLYFKTNAASTLTVSYKYNVGSATSDITSIQGGETVTISWADASSNDPSASFAKIGTPSITFNGSAVEVATTSNGFTFTVPSGLAANTAYTLAIPAGAFGYAAGNTYNEAQNIVINTPAVFDGTYFLKVAATYDGSSEGTSAAVGKYMARGTAYSTHLSLDNYGLPVAITTNGSNQTILKMADTNGYVFSTGSWDAYADGSDAQKTSFTISVQNSKYLIASNNRGAGKYLKYNTTNAGGEVISVFDDGTGSNNGPIIMWAIESISEHATAMQTKKDNQAAAAAAAAYASGNYASLNGIKTVTALESELTANYIEGAFVSPTAITSVQESYQPRNNSSSNLYPVTVYSNTINITSAGFYKFSMQAFNRATWNDNVQAMHEAGADMPAAVLFFGDSETQIKSLYDEVGHDAAVEGADPADVSYNGKYYANCKASALKMFKDDKYHNDVWFYCSTPGTYTYGVKVMGYAAGQWFIYSPESVTITSYAAAATSDDYSALASAISAYDDATWGFEASEYAPYNNVEAINNIAAAKAIDKEAVNSKLLVNSLASAIALSAANPAEVNAIYWDYSTLASTEKSKAYGWFDPALNGNAEGSMYSTRVFNHVGSNAGLEAVTDNVALFTKVSTNYGKVEGYTLPLKAGRTYKLSFKYAGWTEPSESTISITDVNGENPLNISGTITVAGDAQEGNSNAAVWAQYEGYFTVPADGNYVLNINRINMGSNVQRQLVMGDIDLRTATELPLAANTAYAAGTYPTISLDRTFSTDNYSTLVLPFAMDATETSAAFDEAYTLTSVEGESLKFTAANAIAAGTPYLVKAKAATLSASGKAIDPATTVTNTVVKSTDEQITATFVGTFTGENLTSANSNAWVVSNNNLYNVDSNVTVGAYRGYFTVASTTSVKALNLDLEGADGIGALRNAENETMGNAIFNLAGQRINKLQKGVNIINGKKVLVK